MKGSIYPGGKRSGGDYGKLDGTWSSKLGGPSPALINFPNRNVGSALTVLSILQGKWELCVIASSF